MTICTRLVGAQVRLCKSPKRSKTSTPFAPGYVSVCDGTVVIGTIVEVDGSHHAFDHIGNLIGAYRTRQAAMRCLPGTDAIGEFTAVGAVS